MLDAQIRRYEKRIVEEERLAREALTSESSLAHRQVAMIYKTELAIVRRKRRLMIGETLAEIL